jgi:hypothetical protein
VDWGQRKGVVWGIAAAAVGCAIAIADQLMPAREILHSTELTEAGCFDGPAGRGCVAWRRLSVGNTGNVEQDLVRVHLPEAASRWQISTRVFDIRASTERRPDPVILRLDAAPGVVYEIRPLPHNTVVDFHLQCMSCTPEDTQALRTSTLQIEAAAPVREGDPRVLTLARTLGRALGLLIPGG